MRFQPAFDIWQIPVGLLPKIQPGQWVYAGEKDHTGRFMGVKRSGTVVVAWQGNVKNRENRKEYLQFMRQYARG